MRYSRENLVKSDHDIVSRVKCQFPPKRKEKKKKNFKHMTTQLHLFGVDAVNKVRLSYSDRPYI